MSNITLEEIARRLEGIETVLRVNVVTRERYEAELKTQEVRDKAHDRRVDRLESTQTWLMRALVGVSFALIIQVIVVVIQ